MTAEERALLDRLPVYLPGGMLPEDVCSLTVDVLLSRQWIRRLDAGTDRDRYGIDRLGRVALQRWNIVARH